jgi:outer membrane receptor for ferrienterochelin and colicins
MRLNQHILILIVVLLSTNLLGQQATIKVVDQKTSEPIVYAHVCFESLKTGEQSHEVSDESGNVNNPCQERCIVAISYVGYETLLDTVIAGESKNLALKPTILNIDEFVVTAQYTPERADKSIYKVKVIGAKQIEQKGVNNLAELFQDDLSVRVSQDGALGSSMSIRGLSGEHVKFLIDGVPVIGRMNGNIDLAQMNLNNVDHIEIIEGPMSVVYGSNALAGVVNIITKENKNTRLQADAETYLESVGIINFFGSASFKKKRNIFSLAAGRNFFSGYSEADTSRSLQWKPKRQMNIDGYYIYDNKNYKLKFSSQFFNEKLWNKGEVIEPHFALDNYFYTNRFTNKLEYNNKFGKHRYFTLVGAYSIYNRIKNTYWKDLSTLEQNITANDGDNDTTKFSTITTRAVMSKSTTESNLNYQFGLDVSIEDGSGQRITGREQKIGDYAAFLSIKYDPAATFTIQPGVRLIYNTKYNAPLVYSLNLKWTPLEYTHFRASYSRGFRAPSLKELYLYFVDVNHNVQGNENLQAENSHNFNFSMGWNKETNVRVYGADVDFFYNNINNIITLAQVDAGLYTYINVDNYVSKGFQINTNYSVYPYLKLKSGLAYTGRKNVIENREANTVKDFFYSTDVNGSLTYSISRYDMDISVFYKYTGKMPQYFVDASGNLIEGFVSDFHTMDISLIKRFFNRRLVASTGVKNLFDNKTIPAVGAGGGVHSGGSSTMIGWGRTFFLKIAYSFRQY